MLATTALINSMPTSPRTMSNVVTAFFLECFFLFLTILLLSNKSNVLSL